MSGPDDLAPRLDALKQAIDRLAMSVEAKPDGELTIADALEAQLGLIEHLTDQVGGLIEVARKHGEEIRKLSEQVRGLRGGG